MSTAPAPYSNFSYSDWLNQAPYQSFNDGNINGVQNSNWSNPNSAFQSNLLNEQVQGGELQSEFGNTANSAQQLANYYRVPMDQAAGALAQTPGYTSGELGNILDTSGYQQGETTGGQYASMAPTGSQQSAMEGNPNSFMNWFDPAQTQGDITTAAGYSQNDLNNTNIALQNTMNNQSAGYSGAINPSALTVNPALQGQLQNTVGGATSAINSAVNSPNLQLNLAPQNYLMSNQQVQATQNQAAQDVQQQAQSQYENTYKSALASGNADPMALAALQQQSQATGEEAAANAETSANLAATGQQRTLAMNYAQAQLGAGQTQAGLQSSAQENLLGQTLGEQTGYAGLQIGAQQGLTQDQMTAVQNQANTQTGANEYLGTTGVNLQQGVGAQEEAAQQYLTNMGTGITEAQNTAKTGAATQQYQNQLQNQMYQQQNTFNQNTAVQDRQSAAYSAAANARMAGQGQFLNWSTGATSGATNQQLASQNMQAGVYGTQGQLANNAAGQWGNYQIQKNGQPGMTSQVMGGIAGAASAAAPYAAMAFA